MNKSLTSLVFLGILLFPSLSFAARITPTNILWNINEERRLAGVGVVERDTLLDELAMVRIQDMKKYNYFSHVNPATNTSFSNFLPKSFDEKYKGEVLGRWFKTSEGLVNSWINSPTHNHAILNPVYTKTGIAISDGVVVQLFSN